MFVIRDLSSTAQISDPEIRHLVEQRIHDLSVEPYDPDVLGYFLVIEPSCWRRCDIDPSAAAGLTHLKFLKTLLR